MTAPSLTGAEPSRRIVVLTGARSFIGRHLARSLAGGGFEVIGTYRSIAAPPVVDAFPGAFASRAIQVDLLDRKGLAVLPQRIYAVVHVAGLSPAPGVSTDDLVAANVTGTRNAQQYALRSGAERFVMTSTLSVHGAIRDPIVSEHTPVIDPAPYGASKLLAERILEECADNLRVACIRLPGVLGRGAHRAWIPTLAEALRSGKAVTIHHPDAPFNNAAHVEELGRLVVNILNGKEMPRFCAFPVAAWGSVRIREVVEILAKAMGVGPRVAVVEANTCPFTISSEFAVRTFGYAPMAVDAMLRRYALEARE